MKNLTQMMQQAQEMQARMSEMQQQLGNIEITGEAVGGMVEVTLNGKGEMRALKIDPSLLQAGEEEVLADLVIAAHNDAKAKVEARVAQEMSKLTGGLELPPGLKLPF